MASFVICGSLWTLFALQVFSILVGFFDSFFSPFNSPGELPVVSNRLHYHSCFCLSFRYKAILREIGGYSAVIAPVISI